MRKFFSLDDLNADFESKLFFWLDSRKVVCLLNSNKQSLQSFDSYSRFEWCVAIDALSELAIHGAAFNSLRKFHEEKQDWIFGYLTYDLKNEIEKLESRNESGINFPSIHFFQPRYIFLMEDGKLKCGYVDGNDDEESIGQLVKSIESVQIVEDGGEPQVTVLPKVTRADYINCVSEIKKHIRKGDIYEMNYCVEFFSIQAEIHPGKIYEKLNAISPMPFSCYYKKENRHLMCASPERFMAMRNDKIISQPIKGTARRGSSAVEDEQIKLNLKNDEKERSENVMIVDLVRNDLSRTAAKGTVKVEELFGIYSFRQLHQMISTVVSEKRSDVHWTDVIRNAFPMGSMTGAPKIRAMQLIEEFETTKRGLYSGAVGYVTPEGDFDFNVVIRSIQYNMQEKFLSFMVGSAITINSDPEKEYEECLLKAKAMMQVLMNEHEKVS